MIVKLVNPRTGQSLTFQCAGEVYFESQGRLTYDAQQKKLGEYEAYGYEPRRFALWTTKDAEEKIEVTEITMPAGGQLKKPVVILTNFDAYLCNDNGRTIDRIHRYTR